MLVKEFDYYLPKNLIAQEPSKPRDHARLLILNRKDKTILHKKFYELTDHLKSGDVLVLNNSKVIPARLIGKKESGGKIEVFLLQKDGKVWQALIRGKIQVDQKIVFNKNIIGRVIRKDSEDNNIPTYQIKFNSSDKKIFSIGQTPTPPYITKAGEYQTVYAKPEGSVAAPTAGLHFTNRLLSKLKKRGVKIEYITLHVGMGTFAPVKVNKIENHKIHSELAIIDSATAQRLGRAKKNNKRIVAVGTTTVRTLEAFVTSNGKIKAQKKWVDIFIYPGYKFKFVDAIITNFHLPKSTLLMLVSAFATKSLTKKAYREAIVKKYKFYSFGDGMFIE